MKGRILRLFLRLKVTARAEKTASSAHQKSSEPLIPPQSAVSL